MVNTGQSMRGLSHNRDLQFVDMSNHGRLFFLPALFFSVCRVQAGESEIHLPPLQPVSFGSIGGMTILYAGLVICVVGALFGFLQYRRLRALPVHESMSDVSQTIWETCKTYLFQQGKFLAALWGIIAVCMVY